MAGNYSNILSNLSSDDDLCVDAPLIEKVIDLRTGIVVNTRDVLGKDFKKMMNLRDDISNNVKIYPYYACSVCESPVTIASNRYKTGFYFRHLNDYADCPIQTGEHKNKEWMRAEKYRGAKESPEHAELKELIRRSIAADDRLTQPVVEKVWMGGDPRKWRKPDVRSEYTRPSTGEKLRIAFEAQLATTFLAEMSERKQFYLEEGGFLFWIIRDFDFEVVAMSKQDVFINNRCNAFIVDKETTEESERTGVMHFRCLWAEPYLNNCEIGHRNRQEIVRIDQVNFNLASQAAYYYDYDLHKEKAELDLKKVLEKESIERSIARFKSEWKDGRISSDEAWGIATRLVPGLAADKYTIIPFINMLFSAESGSPFGWNYENNVSVFHTIFNKQNKGLCFALCCALKAYKSIPVDRRGDVAKKMNIIRNDLIENGSRSIYVPDKRLDPLAKLLFPAAYAAFQRGYTAFKI